MASVKTINPAPSNAVLNPAGRFYSQSHLRSKQVGFWRRCGINKKSNKSFTLLELLIAIIILGILASIAIPIYTNAIEQKKGEVCINNMRTICTAWRIYNIKNTPYFGGEWLNVQGPSGINQKFNIFIDEKNFGNDNAPKFYFFIGESEGNAYLALSAYRISTGITQEIVCNYYYNKTENNYTWSGTWFDTHSPPTD